LTYSVRRVSDDKENKPPCIPASRRQEKQDGGEKEARRGGGELHKRKRSPQRNRQRLMKKTTPAVGIAQRKLMLRSTSTKKKPSLQSRVLLPQASKTSLYDEHWAAKQERAFMKWLNHILAPVDEFGHTLPSQGRKAQSVSSIDLDPADGAPSSPLPLSGHRQLSRLRRGAFLLYQSQPLSIVITRLEVEIEGSRLMFHPDRCLHADVGMKQDLLHMLLLSYNHTWLKLGLETVFGEQVSVSPAETLSQALATFLLERLLSNQQIAEAYARPNKTGGFREGYHLALSQFILKKFLLLVLFLDHAKLTRLIDHNPCLFQTDSQVKSSRELLQLFSRKYLAGEGDIVRHLSLIGYSATHTQSALDEFDYTVRNLASDLRDGLRLT